MTTTRTYRVYRLDGRGKVRSGDWIEARDDDHACACALDHCNDGVTRLEVWERARLVRQIDCDPTQASPPRDDPP